MTETPTAVRDSASLQASAPSGASADAIAMMRYDANRRSTGVAYLLWAFLGALGVHRFYLKSNIIGAVILISTLLSFVTVGLTFIITAIILLIDLFMIPSLTRKRNLAVADRIGRNVPIA
ncbi:TM2 domain-containing protein [Notoacmeibacter marinus]|uniref:TM2 domain-containing protein n=1 Tax=Notoacmeibacter marinus TaxID=1876515 RepID=UPI000DF16D5E|nr:TM2 domain-containing protein [Notoacmeibacter marinus]